MGRWDHSKECVKCLKEEEEDEKEEKEEQEEEEEEEEEKEEVEEGKGRKVLFTWSLGGSHLGTMVIMTAMRTV